MAEFESITEKLHNILDEHRFYHTLGVSFTAQALAMKYGVDIGKAGMAGLLHDCAKAYKSEELLKLCEDNKIMITDVERKFPALLHAKAGALLAREEYGIADEEILNAIICHTTGKPCMNLLEKIIYVSDYIEPGRYKMKRLDVIRKTAFEDLDEALMMILSDTVVHLNETKSDGIDPLTIETYEYYKEHDNRV